MTLERQSKLLQGAAMRKNEVATPAVEIDWEYMEAQLALHCSHSEVF